MWRKFNKRRPLRFYYQLEKLRLSTIFHLQPPDSHAYFHPDKLGDGCDTSDEDEENGHVHWSSPSNQVPNIEPGRLDLTQLPSTIQLVELVDQAAEECGEQTLRAPGRRRVYLRNAASQTLVENWTYRDVSRWDPWKTPPTELNYWNPTHNYFANELEIDQGSGPDHVVDVVEGNHFAGN